MADARASGAVRWTGLLCAALGAVVLGGWWLDASTLVRLSPSLPAMQVTTALALVFAGLGLLYDRANVRRAAGIAVLLIGVTTVAAFLFESPLVLHRIVTLPVLTTGEKNGLMAPTSALAFCFLGVGLVLAGERRPGTAVPAALTVVAAGAAGLALTDLVFSAARTFELWTPTARQMAIHTAVGLAALGFALLGEVQRLRRHADAPRMAHAVLAGCVALAVTFVAGHTIRVAQVREVQQATRTAVANVAAAVDDELVGWSLGAEDVGRLRTAVLAAAPGYVAVLRADAGEPLPLVAGERPGDVAFVQSLGLALRAGGTATVDIWPGGPLLRSARRPVGLVVLVLGSTLAVLLTVAMQEAATARARATRLEDALASLAASEARLHESRKMEAVARLAGGMAHEFNNLLSVVRGYTHLLGAEGDGAQRESYVAEIDTAATRGAELTRRLLTVSARHVLHTEPVPLVDFLAAAAPMLRRALGPDRRLEMDCAGTADELTASTDRDHLEQSLMTLATNAREATTPGGLLTVRVRPRSLDTDTADAIRVRAGWYVELEIADTGRGMTPERLRSVFEPFGSPSRRAPGAGLGLAMVYGFARQSGGAAEVVSRVGRGTTFRILLPRAAAPAPRQHQLEVVRRTDAPLVLVAEDEDAVRGLMVRVLARAGYEVVAAVNGIDALAKIGGREDDLDVLLTDMIMPELGGIELSEALRARRPGLPVLYVSGYADADIHDGAVLRDACTTFLQKPFSPSRLVESIRLLLDGDPVPAAELSAAGPATA